MVVPQSKVRDTLSFTEERAIIVTSGTQYGIPYSRIETVWCNYGKDFIAIGWKNASDEKREVRLQLAGNADNAQKLVRYINRKISLADLLRKESQPMPQNAKRS